MCGHVRGSAPVCKAAALASLMPEVVHGLVAGAGGIVEYLRDEATEILNAIAQHSHAPVAAAFAGAAPAAVRGSVTLPLSRVCHGRDEACAVQALYSMATRAPADIRASLAAAMPAILDGLVGVLNNYVVRSMEDPPHQEHDDSATDDEFVRWDAVNAGD